jgi:hypothetical protein
MQLLATGALPVRERLCVLLAALDILRGQGEALTIDRRAFYNQLYSTLQLVPLSVLYEGLTAGSSGSNAQPPAAAAAAVRGDADDDESELLLEAQRALDAVRISQLGWEVSPGSSSSSSSGQQQPPTAVLLLRCLEQQLLGVKQTDMARLAAFVKRLCGLMLNSSVSEALGAACLLWRLVKRYPKLVALLEWEGGAPVGGQQYESHCEDPSEAGAMAAAVWELPLLSQHYHPHVAASAKLLLTLTPGSWAAAAGGEGDGEVAAGGGGRAGVAGIGAVSSVIAGALGPQQVASSYEPVRRGGFRPGPQVPKGLGGKGQGSGVGGGSSKAQMAARTACAAGPLTGALLQAVQQQYSSVQQPVVNGGQQLGRKKQKQQQQQSGQDSALGIQQQQQQVLEALEGTDLQAVQQAVQLQYSLSKQYQINQQLRREAAVEARKVELFREHLIAKHQQHKRQQQQQVLQRQSKQQGEAGKQHAVQSKQHTKPLKKRGQQH